MLVQISPGAMESGGEEGGHSLPPPLFPPTPTPSSSALSRSDNGNTVAHPPSLSVSVNSSYTSSSSSSSSSSLSSTATSSITSAQPTTPENIPAPSVIQLPPPPTPLTPPSSPYSSPSIKFKTYFKKWKGDRVRAAPRTHTHYSFYDILWSWIGTVVGIGTVAALHYQLLSALHFAMIIGSFGASAVLVYGAPTSHLAQPRNLVGGHIISAIIGVSFGWLVTNQTEELMPVACALGVATAIAAMQFTKTLHPPGGATALIAVTTARLDWAGYLFVFMPVGTGVAILLLVALIVNNIPKDRKYPIHWY